MNQKSVSSTLPIKQDLTLDTIISLVVALLMTALSIAGFFFPSSVYPTEELQESFRTNDLMNLILGLPILLGSMWLARRGRLVGLLLWPGALLYDFYNYVANLSGTPFSFFTFIYLAILLLCAFIVFDLLWKIDSGSVSERLTGSVSEKITGWILVLFGVAFIFRSVGLLTEVGAGEASLSAGEIGTLFADLVLSTVWIAGGVLILRRKPLGYVSGLGLLFAGSMLFIGLILILILQPILTEAAFVLTDVIVVFVMGLICFVPFGLYLRGVLPMSQST
jgi:hypothetical protein